MRRSTARRSGLLSKDSLGFRSPAQVALARRRAMIQARLLLKGGTGTSGGEPYDACNRCCRSSPRCWRDAQQMTAHLTSILPNTATGITTPITRMARAGPRARRRNSTRSMALGCGRRQLVGANDGACAERATRPDVSDQCSEPRTASPTASSSTTRRIGPCLYLGFSTWHDADRAAREAQGLLVTALACVRR